MMQEEVEYFIYTLLPKLNKLKDRDKILDCFNQYNSSDLIDDEVELSADLHYNLHYNRTTYFVSFYQHLDSYHLEDNISIKVDDKPLYVGGIAKLIKSDKQNRIIRLNVEQSFTELPIATKGIVQEHYAKLINGEPVQFPYEGIWYTIVLKGKKDGVFQFVTTKYRAVKYFNRIIQIRSDNIDDVVESMIYNEYCSRIERIEQSRNLVIAYNVSEHETHENIKIIYEWELLKWI